MHTHQLVLFPVTHTRPNAGIDRSVTTPASGRPHVAELFDELVPMQARRDIALELFQDVHDPLAFHTQTLDKRSRDEKPAEHRRVEQ